MEIRPKCPTTSNIVSIGKFRFFFLIKPKNPEIKKKSEKTILETSWTFSKKIERKSFWIIVKNRAMPKNMFDENILRALMNIVDDFFQISKMNVPKQWLNFCTFWKSVFGWMWQCHDWHKFKHYVKHISVFLVQFTHFWYEFYRN